ncbi:MAG: hypothetical protein JXR48_07525 [Candidatus Delongbacteria bacterium]|nr:hypothetical protein [Candidatus Delongbacteria bacterium]MBN2834801.1 hypothetical protein [Candidatus Delongbacteria bacterium]
MIIGNNGYCFERDCGLYVDIGDGKRMFIEFGNIKLVEDMLAPEPALGHSLRTHLLEYGIDLRYIQ